MLDKQDKSFLDYQINITVKLNTELYRQIFPEVLQF